jgi:hypothetical protein
MEDRKGISTMADKIGMVDRKGNFSDGGQDKEFLGWWTGYGIYYLVEKKKGFVGWWTG